MPQALDRLYADLAAEERRCAQLAAAAADGEVRAGQGGIERARRWCAGLYGSRGRVRLVGPLGERPVRRGSPPTRAASARATAARLGGSGVVRGR